MASNDANHAVANVKASSRNANGTNALNVAITDSNGNHVSSFGGSGGTSATDDGAFTVGTTQVTPAGGVYQATPDSVDDGDTGAIRMTVKRAAMVAVETPNGDTAMDDVNDALRCNVVAGGTAGTQYTEGDTDTTITGTAVMFESNTGTSALAAVSASTPLPVVQTGALPAGTNAIGKLAANSGVDIGDVDVTSCALPTGASTAAKQPALGTAGTASTDVLTVQGIAAMTALKVDGSGVTQPVSAASLPLPTGAATAAKQPALGTAGAASADVITVQGVASMTALATTPAGNVAHDGADSGNPIKFGAKAVSSLATATMVAAADRTDAQSDLDGALIARPNFPLGDLKSDATSNTDGASTASSVFTAVASTRNYVTGIAAHRTDAGATPAYIDFRDGTAGSVLWRAVLPPNGGSVQLNSGVPIFRTSANTALAYDVSAALSTVYINVTGFQSKV
jgi:hypothetical protein